MTGKYDQLFVSGEELKRMIFVDAGYEDEGIPPAMHWSEAAGPRPENIKPLK